MCQQRLDQAGTALLDCLGVDVVGRPAGQAPGGRKLPWGTGRCRAQFDRELLARLFGADRGRPLLPAALRVRRLFGGRPGGRRLWFSGGLRNGRRRLGNAQHRCIGVARWGQEAPEGVADCPADRSEALHRADSRLACGGAGDDRQPHEHDADEDQNRTPPGHGSVESPTDAEADEATGTSQGIGTVVDAGCVPTEVEQSGETGKAEHATHWHPLGDLTELVALAEHGEAEQHHRHGKHQLGEADRPAGGIVHHPADHAGPVEIDGEAGQESTQDQAEAKQLAAPVGKRRPQHAPGEGITFGSGR